MAEEKDITINLRHIMDFGDYKFSACILNTDQVVADGAAFGPDYLSYQEMVL